MENTQLTKLRRNLKSAMRRVVELNAQIEWMEKNPGATIKPDPKPEPKPKPEIELPHNTERFRQAWLEWLSYRKQARKPMTKITVTKQFNFLRTLTEQEAIDAIEQSIQSGYQGLFPPKGKRNAPKNSMADFSL